MRRLVVAGAGLLALAAVMVGAARHLGVVVPIVGGRDAAAVLRPRLETATPPAIATFARRRCRWLAGDARRACYDEILLTLVEARRTRLAMDALALLAPKDPLIRRKGHDFVHVVGINSWAKGEDLGAAFEACTGLFQSGCYHGVVQAYLDATGTDSLTVRAVCDLIPAAKGDEWLRFQCIHGVGHGLVASLDLELPHALAGCDWLPSAFDAESCYGGAFMEFIVAARGQAHRPHHRLAQGHSARQEGLMARRFALRRPDDPLYPCTAVAPRYQSSCYGMQAGIIVETTGPDFEKVADACDRAPPSMRPSCYLGIGTYLSGVTVRDPERAIAECSKGAERYRAWCFVGVVKNFIDVTANVDDGRQFCERITDHDIRVTCFTAVGQQVLALHPSPPDRERKCSAMPADFTGACRYGARLVTDRPEGLPPEWP